MDMKERILANFRELAFTTGFHAATVDELAARTGISKRTIYRYFSSKDEMVGAIMDDLMASVEKSINRAVQSTDDPLEKILSLIKVAAQNLRIINPVIMRDMQRYYPHQWKRLEDFRARKIRSVVEMLFNGNQQGYFRKTNPEMFITALLAAIRDVLNPTFLLEHNLTFEKAIPVLFNIFLYGILAEDVKKPPAGRQKPEFRIQNPEY